MAIHSDGWNVGVDAALCVNTCAAAMFGDRVKACGWFDAILCRQAQHFGDTGGVFAVLRESQRPVVAVHFGEKCCTSCGSSNAGSDGNKIANIVVRTKAFWRPTWASDVGNFFESRWPAVRRIAVDEVKTGLLG